VEASRIYRDLTRAAGEMTTALTLLRTSVEGLRDQDRLMTDYRGEPLGEVLQRYTDSSLAAEQLADVLGKGRPVTELPAYEEVPGGEQRPAAAARSLAELSPTSSTGGSSTGWRPTASTASSPAWRGR
jgi:hypothetical protein